VSAPKEKNRERDCALVSVCGKSARLGLTAVHGDKVGCVLSLVLGVGKGETSISSAMITVGNLGMPTTTAPVHSTPRTHRDNRSWHLKSALVASNDEDWDKSVNSASPGQEEAQSCRHRMSLLPFSVSLSLSHMHVHLRLRACCVGHRLLITDPYTVFLSP
jgi:hypothetical protein